MKIKKKVLLSAKCVIERRNVVQTKRAKMSRIIKKVSKSMHIKLDSDVRDLDV